MPSVAEQLRHAREKQNLTLHQAAELTKIKTDHVRALEAGQFDAFTAPVYVRGFVRTYARYLKMDEARVLSELDREMSTRGREPLVDGREASAETQAPHQGPLDSLMLQVSRLNWRLWTGFCILVAVLVVTIVSVRQWHSSRSTDPLKDLGPGMYEPAQKSSGELLPIPPSR